MAVMGLISELEDVESDDGAKPLGFSRGGAKILDGDELVAAVEPAADADDVIGSSTFKVLLIHNDVAVVTMLLVAQ